jgi:hypothetical protein
VFVPAVAVIKISLVFIRKINGSEYLIVTSTLNNSWHKLLLNQDILIGASIHYYNDPASTNLADNYTSFD